MFLTKRRVRLHWGHAVQCQGCRSQYAGEGSLAQVKFAEQGCVLGTHRVGLLVDVLWPDVNEDLGDPHHSVQLAKSAGKGSVESPLNDRVQLPSSLSSAHEAKDSHNPSP